MAKEKEKDDKISSGILGISGAPVPKSPDDPVADDTEEAAARRRARMREEETEPAEDPDRQRSGATGIDMGYGGQGTHISGKK